MKRILLALGVAAIISGAFIAPAGAAESHSVSLSPLRSTWFKVELMPGEQYRGEAVLKNLLDETINGYLYSADGFSTPQSGFALAERSARGKAVADWAGMPPQRMSLKPKETRMISFTLKVPGLAEPGDYTGGLVFERDRQQGPSKGSARFGLIERVGARIYLTVAGELRPSLAIMKLKRNGSRFEMTVLNDGNAHLTPQPSLSVSSMLGRKVRLTLDKKPEALYPQQIVTYTGTWSRPGLLGRFRASASVGWEGGSDSRRTSFWLIPWVLILVVLAAAAVLFMGIRRGVRWIRRARQAMKVNEAATPPAEVAAVPTLDGAVAPAPAAAASAAFAAPEPPMPVVVRRSRPAPRGHKTVQPKRPTKLAATKSRKPRRVAGTVAKPRRKQTSRTNHR